MMFNGVRNSCETVARNSLLAALARADSRGVAIGFGGFAEGREAIGLEELRAEDRHRRVRREREQPVRQRQHRHRADVQAPHVGEDAAQRRERLAARAPRKLHHLAGEESDHCEQRELAAAVHHRQVCGESEGEGHAAEQRDLEGGARPPPDRPVAPHHDGGEAR
jgi:hypothetical protein